MKETIHEVLQFVEENDVKFIRLVFCDIFGMQKNISIMPWELPRAFERGISFDGSAVRGFMNVDESDLFIVPDAATLSILPWRPSQGRVIRFFCDVKYPDGTPFEGNSRSLLQEASRQAEQMGYVCKIGSECEFYLFETDEKGYPTRIPHDYAGYCDIAPKDRGENVRREICLSLEQMGIKPERSHHEQGPGQNEIDFQYSDAVTAADNLVTFRAVVRNIAARNGLYATFLPKPFPDQSGSGLHINLSLYKDGVNLFKTSGEEHSQEAESFMAGILNHISDITAFLNPLPNSYRRFGAFEAPKYITWSHQNRSQLIRIPASAGEYCRMELRSPDPSCNAHLAFALLLFAGLDGIRNRMDLPKPRDFDLYTVSPEKLQNIEQLPKNLGEAIEKAEQSEFVRHIVPERLLKNYCKEKRIQWENYSAAEDKERLDQDFYFVNV